MIIKGKTIVRFIAIILFTVIVACGPKVLNYKSKSELDIPGYKTGKLLANEDFSNDLREWLPEGEADMSIENGRLLFVSTDSLIKNPKGNLWWKHKFKSPYLLEFDYQSISENGLTMLFWNAQTLDGSEIFKIRRSGKYEEYINGNMQAYHYSFHRFGTGISNLRKSPGFHLLASVNDPIKSSDTGIHKIQIVSIGNQQKVFIDYQLVIEFTDKREPCIAHEEWEHPMPCQGTNEISEKGVFSIRHTQKQMAYYDNFKAYQLKQK